MSLIPIDFPVERKGAALLQGASAVYSYACVCS